MKFGKSVKSPFFANQLFHELALENLKWPLWPVLSQSDLKVCAIGKDAGQLFSSFKKIVKERGGELCVPSLILGPYNLEKIIKGSVFIKGDHPYMDEGSFVTGEALKGFLKGLKKNDVLVVLISGGGSASIEIPKIGFTKKDVIQINKILLESGLPITFVNIIRSECSDLKNGKALKYFKGKKIFRIILSDIPEESSDWVSSSPFKHNQINKEKLKILINKLFKSKLKNKLLKNLESKEKIHSSITLYDHILGNHLTLKNKIKKIFKGEEIYFSSLLNGSFDVESIKLIKKIKRNMPKKRMFFNGELPVEIKKNGKGGRCTHLCLYLTIQIFFKNVLSLSIADLKKLEIGSLAMDGKDGTGNCAGAFFNYSQYLKAKKLNLNPELFLENANSFYFFKKTNGLIGKQNKSVNLMDLTYLFFS